MEFKVLEEGKNRLVFQLGGETHTFCNALKHELAEVSGVSVATYRVNHPLVGVPQFLVETKTGHPREAIKEALQNLKKKAQAFLKEVDKV